MRSDTPRYVQKCSACGALNFTDDKNNPVRICCNCHRTRIASVVPVEYTGEDESAPLSEENQPDDMEDIIQWSSLISKDITLTASGNVTENGGLTATVKADRGAPYMLGRSANQADYLSSDMRVSNYHCELSFRCGNWYVRDNNSANGTFVNRRDIGPGGECELKDGDELRLGHHADSISFIIGI